ncbi:MAG: erythromycin esterase family protein [Bacteroidota bacterium]
MKHLFNNLSKTELSHTVSGLKPLLKKLEMDRDLDPLMERIGDSRYVLLGEASHGTHEYYAWRMKLTQRLIREKGFSFVAVEGDWPDCYRLNRYVKGYTGSGKNATEVMKAFRRWPTWMWANWEVIAFAEWLRSFNKDRSADKRVGFYGLDVYSLFESLEYIMEYLEKTDPKALETARRAVRCFQPYAGEEERYARAAMLVPGPCENDVVELLGKIRKEMVHYNTDHENVFSAEQNALVAVNAEKYYRSMLRGGSLSWNIRDRHMVETLERLMRFHGPAAKAVVWEHNTHIGDARATDMADDGTVNVGQLVMEQHETEGVVLVGFGSYSGMVIAARHWGDVMAEMEVPPAMPGSWESILHLASGSKNKLLLTEDLAGSGLMQRPVGHRAIGVVYNPEFEQFGNYVPSLIPQRYQAFLYLDETTALHPLHIRPDGHQVPETYPFGV